MTELELKLELPPASLSHLESLPILRKLQTPARTEKAVSVYFDTDKQKLRKNGILLRVRRIGDRHIQTIKAFSGSALFERGEWENEIAGDEPDLSLAGGNAPGPHLDPKLRGQLKPIFETRVQRRIYRLGRDGCSIEISLDQGRIDTGEQSQALCELELELKRGQQEALFELATRLVETLPARLAVESKAERGYNLINGASAHPAKAEAPDLHPQMSVAEGARAVGRCCLKQVAGNAPALLAGDPEGVHEMRVGLRRLRAAMSTFREIWNDPETAAIKHEVKWLTGELASARELDVLLGRVVIPARRRSTGLPGLSTISQDLSERRAQAVQRAKTAVDSPRFRRFLIDLAAWLEIGHWATSQDDLSHLRSEAPIAGFAAAALRRRWRKLRKKAKALEELDARGRHKLRIQGKRLRYSAEFFAPLFSGKKARKRRKTFLSKLKGLQDALGDLNDIVVHEGLFRANAGLAARAGKQRGDRKRAFAAGLLSGYEQRRFDAALADAGRASSALLDTRSFW
ncbi:MAG TPA: CHAD domain-containing protein [Xanthobacteraceae bacterium]|nr:CHAD domain-containing protein [Xanthobacteraceae bacterium]